MIRRKGKKEGRVFLEGLDRAIQGGEVVDPSVRCTHFTNLTIPSFHQMR
jgi:hypothetical protein